MHFYFSRRGECVSNACFNLVVMILLVESRIVLSLGDVLFHNDTICDFPSRLGLGCSTCKGYLRSRLECAILCSRDLTCIGQSVDRSGLCYHHRECPALAGCSVTEDDHDYKSKRCLNGGEWDSNEMSCRCLEPWGGDLCEKVQASVQACNDLIGLGYSTGEHEVSITLGIADVTPFPVVCYIDVDSGESRTYLLRNEGNHSFDKDWNEYVSGFAYDSRNLWVGLENWHQMSNRGYTTLHYTLHFPDYATDHMTYFEFTVRGDTESYEYDYDAFSDWTDTTHMPSFLTHTGYQFDNCFESWESPFSARDRDQDSDIHNNCASDDGSGWWYHNGCSSRECNLMGWSWSHFGSKQTRELIHLKGTLMNSVGLKLERIDLYLSESL